MTAAVPSMYVVEDFPPLHWLNAALEDACDAALVELAIDDGECLTAPLDHPGLSFVLR